MSRRDAASLVVHAGTLLRDGGLDGIAEVYAVARELGIETTGIHPSVAWRFAHTHRVSPFCDHVFFVEDLTWGGLLPASGFPSPCLEMHLSVSDEMIMIGGGKHAADELRAFIASGKPVCFVPADMNHAVTRGWSTNAGITIDDFRGAAHEAWLSSSIDFPGR